jgi:hypothetical protein
MPGQITVTSNGKCIYAGRITELKLIIGSAKNENVHAYSELN